MWFKVDDNLAFHQKTLRAGNAAMGMWVRAGSECASQLTDGFVGDELVATLGGKKLAEKLVAARLWLRVEGGYQFHQWSEDGRQPTRSQVEEERKAARLRKQQWRDKRAADAAKSQQDTSVTNSGTDTGTNSGTDASVTGGVPPTPTRPDPTRPDPDSLKGVLTTPSESGGTRKRRAQLPTDWKPSTEDIAWQRAAGILDSVARQQLEIFRDHWIGNGEPKADWSATWRNWLRRRDQFGGAKRPSGNSLNGSDLDPVTGKPKGDGWEFGMDR